MHTLLVSVALMAADPTLAVAQESSSELAPILVTGRARGYIAIDSVTATKTDTPLLDVPQTVNVVTREQMDDQALHSLGEVLRYVPSPPSS